MRHGLVVALSLFITAASFADDPAKPRKIVLIAGKKSHGPGAHDYERTMRLFKVMLDNSNVADRVRVEVHEKGWPADERTLDDADTIVFYSDGRDGDKFADAPFVLGDRMSTLQKQIDRGCGLMTMHFSTFVTDKEGEKVLDWVGGYFDWQDDKGERNWYSKISQVETIELASRDHPIARGVPRMVQLRDEVYWKLRFKPEDRRLTPLWRALDVKDEEKPPQFDTVAWATERVDGGRGFGTSVGHSYRLWQDDGIRKLFLNAIVWTARAEVPEGGVEAKFYSDDEVKQALAGVKGTERAIVEPPLRVLLLTGNKAHAWHNGEKSTPKVKAALESDRRIAVDVSADIEELGKLDLSAYAAVVLNNYCNWQDPKQLSDASKEAFLQYLKRGGGLVVIHFANGAFHFSLPDAGESDWPEYRRIVRRVWDHHGKEGAKSGHDAFGRFTVNVVGEHPIVAGLKDFEVTDELYFNQSGKEPIEPLMTAKSQVTKKDEPLAWAYEYETARVFQTLLGHSKKTYDVYETREILRRAVAWTARRKIQSLSAEEETLAAATTNRDAQVAVKEGVPKPTVSGSKGEHWGVEGVGFKWKEEDSRDDRWKDADIGRFLASSLPLGSAAGTVAKGLSIRLGDKQQATVCYDTANCKLRAAWNGGFLKFTPARYGLILPPLIDGEPQFLAAEGPGWEAKEIQYRGMQVFGERVLLEYLVDGISVKETPWVEQVGEQSIFIRTFSVAKAKKQLVMNVAAPLGKDDQLQISRLENGQIAILTTGGQSIAFQVHGSPDAQWSVETKQLRLVLPASDRERSFQVCMWSGEESRAEAIAERVVRNGGLDFRTLRHQARWTEKIETQGKVAANDAAYVVDTITLPFDNPYKALFFTSGHDALRPDAMAVCTVHGDVWVVSGVDEKLEKLRWKRFATGLFQPLGLVAKEDGIYVLGRDQITRLKDENGDGEADVYECFSNQYPTSAGGHDYTTCLETDELGNFYFITANQGIWRLSADGKQLDNLAGGLRNPNGLGVGPGPVITAAPQEGNWTPASYIAEARAGDWFGYPGPKVTPERPLGWTQPLCFIPRRRDNSSGGQVWATSDRWGPLASQMLHFSYGQCRMMLVLREVIQGQPQGGTVDMAPLFDSGAMRGRINPYDGQLYVTGLRGWTTAATQDGCLQRVRYTGQPVHMPVQWRTLQNGVAITFAEPLRRESAQDVGNYHLEQWNYRYAESYGSPDFKVSDPKQEGHDVVRLDSATLLDDGKTVFLEINDLKPVNQLTVGYALAAASGEEFRHTIAYTIHNLGDERMDPALLHRQSVPGRLTEEVEQLLRPGLIARLSQGQVQETTAFRMAALHFDAPKTTGKRPLKLTLEGYLQVPLKGDYELALWGRGKASIAVNDYEYRTGAKPGSASSAKVSLHGGYNKLRIEYESDALTGGSEMRLLWSTEGQPLEPVLPTAFFHRGDDAELIHDRQLEWGRELLANRHCARCHRAEDRRDPRGIHQPPLLAKSSHGFTREWVAQWLLNPHKLRNHATMPRLFNSRPQDRQTAADLAAYLTVERAAASLAQAGASDEEHIVQGHDLYENLGCITCHKLTPPEEDDEFDRISLHFINAKYGEKELGEYLRDPHQRHASSRMPNFHLSGAEAALLIAFLQSAATGKVDAIPELATADAKRGAEAYRALRCSNCHAEPDQGLQGPLVLTGFRRLEEGCLSHDRDKRGAAPALELQADEREALVAYLRNREKPALAFIPARVSQSLYEELRCNACHKRDTSPGPRIAILTEESERGLTPELLPDLTWAGEKLHSDWVEKQIAGRLDRGVRPWLKARMPSFPAYAEALSHGMAAEHGVELSQDTPQYSADLARIGEQLTLKEHLDCRQCHGVGDLEPMGDDKTKLAPGINFSFINDRLRHDYYRRFVLDPPRWDISTRMPKLAADGRTTKVTSFYDGDAEKQFEAIWNYIQTVPSPTKR